MATFNVLANAWIEGVNQRADLASSTRASYAFAAKTLAAWAGAVALEDLDWHQLARERAALGRSPRTLRLHLRVWSLLLQFARERGDIGPDVLIRVPRIRVDPARFYCNHRTPTVAEVAAVIGAMPSDDWRLAALLLARTGARVGEITHLRMADLDVAHGCLALGATERSSKTGLRWFPLDPDSLCALDGRTGDPGTLLLDLDGLHQPIQGIQRRLAAACRRAGVEPFSPHALRRMVVTRLLRAGINAGTAASLTGHTVEVMLRHYQQVDERDRREAVVRAKLGILSEDDDRAPVSQVRAPRCRRGG